MLKSCFRDESEMLKRCMKLAANLPPHTRFFQLFALDRADSMNLALPHYVVQGIQVVEIAVHVLSVEIDILSRHIQRRVAENRL